MIQLRTIVAPRVALSVPPRPNGFAKVDQIAECLHMQSLGQRAESRYDSVRVPIELVQDNRRIFELVSWFCKVL
jgi:hypothetical protein